MLMIVGAPGSGKSAQAKLIENEANVKWLSTGQLLRDDKNNRQNDVMEQGILVDDAYVEDVLANAIEEVSNGTRILIDGFPRNDSQVHWFRGYTRAARRDLEAIIHIKVPEDEVVKRLIARGRADDDEEVVRTRYKMYQDQIIPMVEHMAERGTRVVEVDGTKGIQEIHAEIMAALKGTI